MLLAVAAAFLALVQDPEPILERLKNPDEAERRRALEDLRACGAAAVPAAVQALDDASSGTAEKARALAGRLSSPAWKDRDEAARNLVKMGARARTVLEESAASEDPEVAWRARAALSEIDERAAEEARLEDARDAALCEFLGDSADARAAAPLLGRPFAAGSPETRLRAAEALGRLRPTLDRPTADAAAERIIEALRAPDVSWNPLQKARLVRALERLASPACVSPLSAVLARSDEKNVHVLRAVLRALAATEDPRGLRAVVETLESGDPVLRDEAAALLAARAGDRFGYEATASADRNRAAVEKFHAWWCGKFGQEWAQ